MRGGCDPDTDVSSHVGDMTLGLPPPTPEAFEAFVDKREEELVTETRMLRKRYCDPATNKTTHVTRERWTWEEERAAACLHWLVVHAMRPPAEALWREAKLDGSGERQAPPADGPPVFLDLPRLLEESKVDARWDVKAALLGGDVADARRLVDSALGGAFLSEHSELLFEMLLQEFVEMVRAAHEAWVPPGKPGELGIADARGEGLERAVRFAQEELSLFCEANPSYNRMLEDALMVLTIDPRDAPVAGEGAERDKTDKSRLLFSPMRRMELFLLVNSAMLRHLGLDPQTGWEKMEVLTSWLQQEFGEEGWVRDLRGSLNDAGEEDRETRVAALIGRGGERFKDWWRVAPVSEAAFNASAVTRGVAAMQHMAAFMDRDDHPLTEEEEDALEKMRAVADEMAAGGDGDPDEVLGD